jgi:hypothetical protein
MEKSSDLTGNQTHHLTCAPISGIIIIFSSNKLQETEVIQVNAFHACCSGKENEEFSTEVDRDATGEEQWITQTLLLKRNTI